MNQLAKHQAAQCACRSHDRPAAATEIRCYSAEGLIGFVGWLAVWLQPIIVVPTEGSDLFFLFTKASVWCWQQEKEKIDLTPSPAAVPSATAPAVARPTADATSGARTAPKVQKLFDGKSLQGWKVTEFGGQGPVRVEEGRLVLTAGAMLTGVTWTGPFPTTDYEVQLEAMRVAGSDFFCALTFPVGDAPCSLIVGGWGGTLVGLSSIDNMDASENETTGFHRFETGRWYTIRLRVTGAKVEAWIDGEQVVDVLRAGREFSIRIEVELSQPFGLASWQTTAALRKITLRRL